MSSKDENLSFIVSHSSTAPDYSTMVSKPYVFYTRSMKANTLMNLYLSVTDKTPETPDEFTTEANAIGNSLKLTDPTQFLKENTTYYLYMYDDTGAMIEQIAFKTIAYPTVIEDFIYPNDIFIDDILFSGVISYKQQEILIFPARVKNSLNIIGFILPELIDGGSCTSGGLCSGGLSNSKIFGQLIAEEITPPYLTSSFLLFSGAKDNLDGTFMISYSSYSGASIQFKLVD